MKRQKCEIYSRVVGFNTGISVESWQERRI